MEFDCILYEKRDNLATVKLQRPKVLNAMNSQMWSDLQAALDGVKNDPQIKVLFITGEGQRILLVSEAKKLLELHGAPVSKDRMVQNADEAVWMAASVNEAVVMIEETKSFPILDGVRGTPPSDKKAIRKLLLLCSEVIESYPDIAEMDLNPIIVYNEGLRIVDARIILKECPVKILFGVERF
jgi:acyl-CoA synthetase (NDP forming)